MPGQVLELNSILGREHLAEDLSNKYENWRDQLAGKYEEWRELRNYLFATSTADTSNKVLPWSNSTTTPKLTQIRDNLHANYMDALFPNDRFFKWEGATADSVLKDKKDIIEQYMANKVRNSGFRETISELVYDYIDYGVVIGDVEFVKEEHTNQVTGEVIPGYIGPKIVRISPLDIVFNIMAPSFADAPKFTRIVTTLGELKRDLQTRPELEYDEAAIAKVENVRTVFSSVSNSDTIKGDGYLVDGFGNIQEYLQQPYIELLIFQGDIHDTDGTLLTNQQITIVDRSYILAKHPIRSWLGKDTKTFTSWRPRPDNLMGMGPLDNLVGMQYRIDHLENIKADLFDLIALPPLKIRGNVEEFEFGPLSKIFIGDDGDVEALQIPAIALQADTQINELERRMEEMAGAPKEAMGMRSPGEKTAFEVQQLNNAAARIFNNRINNFEINILEPLLNNMLEVARRNIEGHDLIRVLDDDIGVINFLNITKEDITAEGKLRPVGARHYAARNQLVQNLSSLFNSKLGDMIAPHISPKNLAKLVEEAFGWERHDVIRDNAMIEEQAETQRLMNAAQDDIAVESITPLE